MLVGSMNFPGRSIAKELHRIAEDGFDFVDLTLEPPAAWNADGKEVGRLIGDLGLGAVGHTSPHMPVASPFPEIRTAVRDLFRRAFDTFADAGVEIVNVHPQERIPAYSLEQIRAANGEAIALLEEDAAARAMTLMVENMPLFSRAEDLDAVFRAAPAARFHLDIAHANLNTGRGRGSTLGPLIDAFGDRIVHVHVSDNRGGADDLHLPLGAGSIDWRGAIRALKGIGYDGTVTLEVFSREREHLRTSRRLWLEWWSRT